MSPRSTTCAAHTAMPGVQMPHCAPPQRRARAAPRAAPRRCARPSTVVTLRPSHCADRDEARVDDLAVEHHRARAALALAAAFLRAGEAQVLAQHVEQPLPRRDLDLARAAPLTSSVIFTTSLQRGCSRRSPRAEIGSASNAQPSASSTAFATAAAGPSIGISPTPFAPLGPNGYGTSTRIVSSSGASANVGTMQFVMFAFATLPSLVDDVLEQRPAERLQRAALDLALARSPG